MSAEEGDGLSGTPASAGSYTGPARVIRSEEQFHEVRPGDVLVCPITTPAWSVLFGRIGGLITDTGGGCCRTRRSSPASTVSRRSSEPGRPRRTFEAASRSPSTAPGGESKSTAERRPKSEGRQHLDRGALHVPTAPASSKPREECP